MFEIIPDVQRLTQIFQQATAPTFFLGAVAAFVTSMSNRLTVVLQRIRVLNGITEQDQARFHLKADLARLHKRARLLSSGIATALLAGICATALLAIIFASEFIGLKYFFGAGLLFIIATLFFGFALVRFAQEARIGLADADEYE